VKAAATRSHRRRTVWVSSRELRRRDSPKPPTSPVGIVSTSMNSCTLPRHRVGNHVMPLRPPQSRRSGVHYDRRYVDYKYRYRRSRLTVDRRAIPWWSASVISRNAARTAGASGGLAALSPPAILFDCHRCAVHRVLSGLCQGTGAGPAHTRVWVGLNRGATPGSPRSRRDPHSLPWHCAEWPADPCRTSAG
jgi:hypothetical protein